MPQRATLAFASSLLFAAVVYFEVGLDALPVAPWIAGLGWLAIALVTLYFGFSSMLRHESRRSVAISAIVLVLAVTAHFFIKDRRSHPHIGFKKEPNQSSQPMPLTRHG